VYSYHLRYYFHLWLFQSTHTVLSLLSFRDFNHQSAIHYTVSFHLRDVHHCTIFVLYIRLVFERCTSLHYLRTDHSISSCELLDSRRSLYFFFIFIFIKPSSFSYAVRIDSKSNVRVYMYVCIWQRMSPINNTSIRTYKKSNIIHDFYHSIFDFCYLSFRKIFFALRGKKTFLLQTFPLLLCIVIE